MKDDDDDDDHDDDNNLAIILYVWSAFKPMFIFSYYVANEIRKRWLKNIIDWEKQIKYRKLNAFYEYIRQDTTKTKGLLNIKKWTQNKLTKYFYYLSEEWRHYFERSQ